MKWEYCEVICTGNVLKSLNKMGQEGWELVAGASGSLFLKRHIQLRKHVYVDGEIKLVEDAIEEMTKLVNNAVYRLSRREDE